MGASIHITPEMRRQFHSETADHLKHLERLLIRIEQDPEREDLVHTAFRYVHSIKGNSDYLGVADLNGLAHLIEDLMDDLRTGRMAVTPAVIDILLRSLDLLREMNRRIVMDEYEATNIEPIRSAVARLREDGDGAGGDANPPEKTDLSEKADPPEKADLSEKADPPETKTQETKAQETKAASDENAASDPAADLGVAVSDVLDREIRLDVATVDRFMEHLAEFATARNALSYLTEGGAAGPGASGNAGRAPAGDRSRHRIGDRPSGRHIDQVSGRHVDQVSGRHVDQVSGRHVDQVSGRHVDQVSGRHVDQVSDRISDRAGELRAVSADLLKVFNSFQTDLMALRMVRFDTLFDRLARMIRDLSVKRGKKVALKVSGGQIAVDREIMARLIDPLVHLARNAVDHGIEDPADRRAAGKPETGVIRVDVRMEGARAVIEVADDGRGLDVAAIREAAIAGGFADRRTLSAMEEEAVLGLVFKAGLTTRRQVDAVSGRGVGLDVVDSNLRAIGGGASLSAAPGGGTLARLRAPVTLSVTEILLIRDGKERYGIPLSGIHRVLRVRPERVRGYRDARIMIHQRRALPVRRLRTWLGAGTGTADTGDMAPRDALGQNPAGVGDEMTVIVVGNGQGGRGIIVDEVMRRESVVIRPLRRFLRDIRLFCGAAVMGDGGVVMVIDPMAID